MILPHYSFLKKSVTLGIFLTHSTQLCVCFRIISALYLRIKSSQQVRLPSPAPGYIVWLFSFVICIPTQELHLTSSLLSVSWIMCLLSTSRYLTSSDTNLISCIFSPLVRSITMIFELTCGHATRLKGSYLCFFFAFLNGRKNDDNELRNDRKIHISKFSYV